MCCRYYIDDNTIEEFSDLLQKTDSSSRKVTPRDIHPGDIAPIIKHSQSGLTLDEMKWGFPQYGGKGFYNLLQDEVRFVILTTQANESVSPIHDRMPLILEKEEVKDWICDDSETGVFLKKMPLSLQRQQEYEQQSLFDMI